MDTRSRMCHEGWEVWVHGVSAITCITEFKIFRSMVSHYVCRRKCTYTYPIHIQCAIIYKNMGYVVIVSLIYSSCYYILLLY